MAGCDIAVQFLFTSHHSGSCPGYNAPHDGVDVVVKDQLYITLSAPWRRLLLKIAAELI